jgi:hypothetical protein
MDLARMTTFAVRAGEVDVRGTCKTRWPIRLAARTAEKSFFGFPRHWNHAVLGSSDREPRAGLSEFPQQLGFIRLAIHHEPGPDAGGVLLEDLVDAVDGCTPVLHLRVALLAPMISTPLRLAPLLHGR